MIEFRRFTKGDWIKYAGANRLYDGSDPFIGFIKVIIDDKTFDAEVIVTLNGPSIFVVYDGEGYPHYSIYHLDNDKFKLVAAIILQLNPVMTHSELIDIGFNHQYS